MYFHSPLCARVCFVIILKARNLFHRKQTRWDLRLPSIWYFAAETAKAAAYYFTDALKTCKNLGKVLLFFSSRICERKKKQAMRVKGDVGADRGSLRKCLKKSLPRRICNAFSVRRTKQITRIKSARGCMYTRTALAYIIAFCLNDRREWKRMKCQATL